jgi:hypothetical protein
MFAANDNIHANATASFNKYKIFAGTPKCLLATSVQNALGIIDCSRKDYAQETLKINYVFQNIEEWNVWAC